MSSGVLGGSHFFMRTVLLVINLVLKNQADSFFEFFKLLQRTPCLILTNLLIDIFQSWFSTWLSIVFIKLGFFGNS
jgi:hypothetical protein